MGGKFKEQDWAEARRRCRLSDEELRMAKELGFSPRGLIKNIPSPGQQWKVPVNLWVRSLYEKKFESRAPAAGPVSDPAAGRSKVVEFRNPGRPWPDNPEIPDLSPIEISDFDDFESSDYEEPEENDIEEENGTMLRRQRLFRWAAQSIAIAFSELPAVTKVAAFGAVARPLDMEVPRFSRFRRHGIKVLHECADLDLAVWLDRLDVLKDLKKAMSRGLAKVQNTPYGGVAHHQVDVHIFDAAESRYRGRLCAYGQCPKGKRECLAPRCGEELFLQQFESYHFHHEQFESEAKVLLFDRATGFRVYQPRIEGKSREIKILPGNNDDVPF